MAISKEDILEAVSSMSVLDLSELIKEMEEKISFLRKKIDSLTSKDKNDNTENKKKKRGEN